MGLIDAFKELGKTSAQYIKDNFPTMTETEIIDREHAIAPFNPRKDYTNATAGTPVTDEGQVWKLLIPHNASHYVGRPSTLRSLWGLLHTKNPAKAKPWVAPYGTSGLYNIDEVYKEDDGKIYKCIVTQTNFRATEVPSQWEEVIMSD